MLNQALVEAVGVCGVKTALMSVEELQPIINRLTDREVELLIYHISMLSAVECERKLYERGEEGGAKKVAQIRQYNRQEYYKRRLQKVQRELEKAKLAERNRKARVLAKWKTYKKKGVRNGAVKEKPGN